MLEGIKILRNASTNKSNGIYTFFLNVNLTLNLSVKLTIFSVVYKK